MKFIINLFYLKNKFRTDKIILVSLFILGELFMKKIDFEQIYKIMDESFPDKEKRTYSDQLALLEDKRCKVFVERNKENEIITFLLVWIFNDFCFIEYLATDKRYRNLGLGSRLLNSCIKEFPTPIIIEVEPPENDINKRRIEFYTRLGFHLNNYKHKQPSLQKHTEPCELLIMSYPSPIVKKEFLQFRNKIFNTIYKIKPSSIGLEE